MSDMTKTSSRAPLTSVLAASRAKDGSQRADIVRELHKRPKNGLTAFELSKLMGVAPNQVAARLLELREIGTVTRTLGTRETTPGNRGHVHVLSA